ncbi:hypothetical protein COU54_05600 [Candidatus Pacearchaeota archaeon CG10_big_fil_rev_8_21_14_0_10_31_24]|nr:MAG: hypothetical protein COU54_05600 [Candidatus Pacearchaeota archaeon CG10_big_fil_rev_8_21_14_0_10_31_24]
MRFFEEVFNSWKIVFGNWRFSLLAIVSAILFYILQAIIGNAENMINFYKGYSFLQFLSFSLTLIIGFWYTLGGLTLISVLIISLLTGILISLIVYRVKFIKEGSNGEGTGFFVSIGIFLGILVPGCAACGIGVVSLLGLGTAVASLPFEGAEISVLAILVLVFVIIKTSLTLFTCKRLNSIKHEKK